jgi:hypothetical protein
MLNARKQRDRRVPERLGSTREYTRIENTSQRILGIPAREYREYQEVSERPESTRESIDTWEVPEYHQF